MIEVFKFTHKLYNCVSPLTDYNVSERTRGHNYKLCVTRSRTNIRSGFFCNRVIKDWNNLPESVVNATNLNTFKNCLDNHWGKTDVYNFI